MLFRIKFSFVGGPSIVVVGLGEGWRWKKEIDIVGVTSIYAFPRKGACAG